MCYFLAFIRVLFSIHEPGVSPSCPWGCGELREPGTSPCALAPGAWGHGGTLGTFGCCHLGECPHGHTEAGGSWGSPEATPNLDQIMPLRHRDPVGRCAWRVPAEMGLAVVNSHPRETQTHSLWVNASRPRFWGVLNQIKSDGDLCRTAAQCLGGALLTVQGFLRQRWFRADYYERLPRARVICKAVRT